MARFARETHLVEEFARCMRGSNPFRSSGTSFEFDYKSGRTDVISKNDSNKLFAFEAKLSNWKIALHQAYRNSHYAHFSYVVLPSDRSTSALKNKNEFKRRGVGLCLVSDQGLRVEIRASQKKPLLPWVTRAALLALA